MRYLLIILLFSSCITQTKVTNWLNNHQTEAAKYCSDRFPVVEKKDTVYKEPDTSKYHEAYGYLWHTLDSALAELKRKTEAATPEKPYRPNVDSIRSVLIGDIRRGLKPCKDSILYVKYTTVDRAREVYLQGQVDARDATITSKDKLITTWQEKYAGAIKYMWMFWALVVLIGLYALLRFKFKLPI